ncbi:MAG: GntR family transcriptional regulator [Gemmataceae bacterium]
MRIHLNTSDGVPIYVQIVQQVKYLIAAGRLSPGAELPPIRALAEQLVINPNTVARAYKELERLDLVVKNGTAGTAVSPRAGRGQPPLTGLVRKADELVREARRQDVGADEVAELVRQRYRTQTPNAEEES